MTSMFGSVDLKIGISKHCGANHFSPCCLFLQWQVLCASLTVEYPSESAPPLSGEDGSEFSVLSFVGHVLGGLPLGCEVGTLGVWPPPVSSACPIHAAEGRVLPTNGGMESNLLEIRLGTGGLDTLLWTFGSIYPKWPLPATSPPPVRGE